MKPLKPPLYLATLIGLSMLFITILGWWGLVMFQNIKVLNTESATDTADKIPALTTKPYLDILQGQ